MYHINNNDLLFDEFMNLKNVGYKIAETHIQELAGIVQNKQELSIKELNRWINLANEVEIKLNYIHRMYMEMFRSLRHRVIENVQIDNTSINEIDK